MKTYITKRGDKWDGIAYTQMGSCEYVDHLIDANNDYTEIYIFPAGIELVIPDVDTAVRSNLPPWRR